GGCRCGVSRAAAAGSRRHVRPPVRPAAGCAARTARCAAGRSRSEDRRGGRPRGAVMNDAATGNEAAELTLVEAVNAALARELEADPAVLVLGEDVGVNGGVFRATAG